MAGFNPYWLIPLIGVLAWAAVVIVWTVTRNRRRGPEDVAASREQTDKILARLDALDTRLAAVEKTLSDIP